MIDRDTQLFILAIVVVLGGGVALIFGQAEADVRTVIAGFIGVVLTYFFGRAVAVQAVQEQNGALQRAVDRATTTSEAKSATATGAAISAAVPSATRGSDPIPPSAP